MSFFFGLKAMANAPVASMQYGGLFWFQDLTICDPTYMLPLLTSVTLWATIEVRSLCAHLTTKMKYVYSLYLLFASVGN